MVRSLYAEHVSVICLILLVITMPLTYATEYALIYDVNGNLVSGDGKYRVYNSFNQLWKVYNGSSDAGTLLQEFSYHPLEERVLVKKTYNSTGGLFETVYYWSENFITVINASGTYNFTYVYHNGELIAQSVNGVKTFFHNDIKGSVVAVSNASGAVIENISYSPLGEVITGGNTTRYEYEGKESDLVIGDTDFNARRYKPDFGIFEQPDSLIQNVHDPQNLNRYMFERGNSYNRVDPTGHIIWVLFGIIVGIGLLTGVLYMKSHPYTPENKLNYAAKAVAHAETAGIVAGLTSGYSASGPLVTYSAPSLLEIGLYGAGQSVIDQSIEGQSIDPGLVAQDTATSMLLSEIFSPAITRQGQIMPTQSVGNIYAMDTYYSTYASYLFNNMISSMSSDANAASSGGRSGGGNTGHWGENQYAYTDPNDYPEDPNGVCQAPPPPKPNPFRLT